MSDPLCRDCGDLRREVKATRFIGKTPVCDEHMRSRLGQSLRQPAIRTKEKTNMGRGRKAPDQTTIDAMKVDAKNGLSIEQIRVKHNVGWMTAKKYIGDGKRIPPPSTKSAAHETGRGL